MQSESMSLTSRIARVVAWVVVPAAISAGPAFGQDSTTDQDLAKKLANPIASLISVPFQFNYDQGLGPDGDGNRVLLNFQPVIPISINDDWNLISRTIVPIVWQDDVIPGAGSEFGLGNTVQSLFFSPARPVNGFTWGVGPVLYLPTNTDDQLGNDTWGAGPTGVGLWQGNGWTVGMLANHIWSFAGESDAPDVNATFLQPFVSYTTKDAWTFSLNTESTYDWEAEAWSIPVNAVVSKLVTIGDQPVSLFVGARYWVESPDGTGPDGFGARAGVTLLFPK